VAEADLAAQLAGEGIAAAAAGRVFATARLRGREAVARALAEVPGGVEAGAPLARTLDALDAMGLGGFVDVDLTIVRGLAYYTGTVFELFDAGRSLRALCGGGRYDELLKLLGGADLPAVGFAIGDVVLGELMKERGLAPAAPASVDVFLGAVTEADVPHVLALAHELRDAGLRVEYALGAQAIGKQLKLADARGARWTVVTGPDDRARGEVMLKDLQEKTQRAVARADVVATLAEAVASASTPTTVSAHG
jgi:histidyl-tRNA synthetase